MSPPRKDLKLFSDRLPPVADARSDYAVGYGRPPAATRFAPDKSGNPKGRPRGSKNRPKSPALNEERMKTILMQEAYRTIKVNDGARQVTIPMAQAIIRSLAVNAAKGNQRSQRLFTQLLAATETANKRLHDEWLETAITYKVEWEGEIDRCKQAGIEPPSPLPHPDDIVIDMKTGNVRIKGPMTKEEQKDWDWLRNRKHAYQEEVRSLCQMLIEEPNCDYRKPVEEDIERCEKMLARLREVIPD